MGGWGGGASATLELRDFTAQKHYFSIWSRKLEERRRERLQTERMHGHPIECWPCMHAMRELSDDGCLSTNTKIAAARDDSSSQASIS